MWSLTGSLDPAALPCRKGRQQTYTHLADTSCLPCEKSPAMCRELYQLGSGLTARIQPAPVPELPSLPRVPCRVPGEYLEWWGIAPWVGGWGSR